MLRCGMSEVVITPSLGNFIPGHFRERRSTGMKDELYAKSLVIEGQDMTLAIIVLDAIDLTKRIVQGIRQRVQDEINIPASRVMVSCTHTHTGPPVKSGFSGSVNEGYVEGLIQKAADSAIIAFRNRRAAQIGVGRGEEKDIAFHRRFRMKDGTVRTNPGIRNPLIDLAIGPIDPEVLVLRIDDADGNPIGIVSNYACHTDVVSGTEYSADYPGEISSFVKRNLGAQAVSLFIMGASGNINHIDVSGARGWKPDYYKFMGRVLAHEILKVREKAVVQKEAPLQTQSVFVEIGLRHPSDEEIARAERELQEGTGNEIELAFAKQVKQILEQKETAAHIEVQVTAIGDLAIVGLPGEIFVEFGLEIKERSPFAFTVINELCNGSVSGYVCTREAYRQGGYEPRITNSSRLAEDAGELMVQHAAALLEQMSR